ncbi:SHOCT domain-containing protein [Clostridium sp. DJ247]|uniref:SHOCT domain-containing protein n=1 Tax=Clostridium sp. DJ247 TaxID=2726188 RepID=UPI00162ADD9B|nr:SHOCT domain-containing protein [Clostridium sp. DJ247]MBC2581708.1 SHOCT domain-containing protein [Clostridium sp. DJ247]
MFCGYGFYNYGLGTWGFLMMGIRMLLFVVLIVLGIKLIKNYISSSNNAIKILDEKFAKGEISEEEYIKRKNFITEKN